MRERKENKIRKEQKEAEKEKIRKNKKEKEKIRKKKRERDSTRIGHRKVVIRGRLDKQTEREKRVRKNSID